MGNRAGVVGCGRIGCGFDDDPRWKYVRSHAAAYDKAPGFELVALCDVDSIKLERYGARYAVPGRYTDTDEMLSKERLDILSVCTHAGTHAPIIETAAKAGVRAIFCEKPIADTLEAADRMIALCEKHSVLLFIGHQRRFEGLHLRVQAFVRQGGLGRVQQVTMYYTAGIGNTGTHLIDYLRFLFGEAAWVQGIKSANPSPDPGDPNIDGWIRFRDGPLVALQAVDVKSYNIFELVLLGDKGRLRVGADGFEIGFETVGESAHAPGYRALRPSTPPFDASPPRQFMLEAMAHIKDCMDGKATPSSTGRDGRQALEIILALLDSASDDGRRVDLPLVHRRYRVRSRR